MVKLLIVISLLGILALGVLAFNSGDESEEAVAALEAALTEEEENPIDTLEIATPEKIKTEREKSADEIYRVLGDIYKDSSERIKKPFIDQIIHFDDLSSQIRNNIRKRQKTIRLTIGRAAYNIHQNINFQLSSDGNTIRIEEHSSEATKANEHLQRSNVSVNSIIFALQLVAEIAQRFGEDLQNEQNIDEQFEKYIEYTIIMYELAGEMIRVLEHFEHKGFAELTSMSNKHIREIGLQRKDYVSEIENIKSELKAGKIDESHYKTRTNLYKSLIENLKPAEEVWKEIQSNLGDKEKVIKEIMTKIELLKEKRKDAMNVLKTFEQVKIAKNIKNLPQDVFKTADFILDMPLYIPDERTIQIYLGLEYPDAKKSNSLN